MMHYGYTSVDLGSYALTLLGLAGLIWFWRARPISMPEAPRSWLDPSDRVDDDDVDPRDPDWWLDPEDPMLGPPLPPGRAPDPSGAPPGGPPGDPSAPVPVAEFDPATVILGPVADVGSPDLGAADVGAPDGGSPEVGSADRGPAPS